MKRLLSIGLAIIVSPLVALFVAEASEHPAKSSVVFALDSSHLVFDGEPDKYGLIVLFGIPSAPAFDWPVVVYNATDEPMMNLRLKVYEYVDGEKRTFDDNLWIYPWVVNPREFGFGGANLSIGGEQFFGGPEDGLDAELSARPLAGTERDDIADLKVETASMSESGHLEGIVSNSSGHDVNKIEIHVLCVEDSGVPASAQTQILDRRLLKDGTSADFQANFDNCDGDFFVTSIAQFA